jgi:hypothetical protein
MAASDSTSPSSEKSAGITPSDDPLATAARANPALTIAVITGAVIVARLLAVSDWRVEVGVAILGSAGVTNVLLGSALMLVPFAAPASAIYFAETARSYYAVGRRAYLSALGAIVAGYVSFISTPVALLALLAVFFAVAAIYTFARSRQGRPLVRRKLDPIEYVVTVALVPLLWTLLTFTTPWLPVENITVNGQPIVGYVSSSDSRWTEVLVHDPRVLRIFETSEISSREPCQLPKTSIYGSLREVLNAKEILADCAR